MHWPQSRRSLPKEITGKTRAPLVLILAAHTPAGVPASDRWRTRRISRHVIEIDPLLHPTKYEVTNGRYLEFGEGDQSLRACKSQNPIPSLNFRDQPPRLNSPIAR